MTDLEAIEKIASGESESLMSLECIASFLQTDVNDPMVYCEFKQCNKDKLNIEQIESIDKAIKVLKRQYYGVMKKNDEYMDRHLITDNINDNAN